MPEFLNGLPDNCPQISFDTNLGEHISSFEVDYERLGAAMLDAGIPSEHLADISIHISKTSTSMFSVHNAGLTANSETKNVPGNKERLLRLGYQEHQFEKEHQVLLFIPIIERKVSRGALRIVFGDSLVFTDETFNKVAAHELRHVAQEYPITLYESTEKEKQEVLDSNSPTFKAMLIKRPLNPLFLSLNALCAVDFFVENEYLSTPKFESAFFFGFSFVAMRIYNAIMNAKNAVSMHQMSLPIEYDAYKYEQLALEESAVWKDVFKIAKKVP